MNPTACVQNNRLWKATARRRNVTGSPMMQQQCSSEMRMQQNTAQLSLPEAHLRVLVQVADTFHLQMVNLELLMLVLLC